MPLRSEGWQSGRMRRSRKPLSVVRRIEGSNPSPSAPRAETDAADRVRGSSCLRPGTPGRGTGTSRDPLTRPRTGARPARAELEKGPPGGGAGLTYSLLAELRRAEGDQGGRHVTTELRVGRIRKARVRPCAACERREGPHEIGLVI